jgi:hypothetical protein
MITFTPGIIPFSAQEIGNPISGPAYYGAEQPPPDFALVQYSKRLCVQDVLTERPRSKTLRVLALAQALAPLSLHGRTCHGF